MYLTHSHIYSSTLQMFIESRVPLEQRDKTLRHEGWGHEEGGAIGSLSVVLKHYLAACFRSRSLCSLLMFLHRVL